MIHPSALRYFLAVAQSKSIRRASDELRISQSAVSRKIMQIEAELGLRLFNRLAHGIELTTAGEMFLRYARHNAGQIGRLKTEIKALEDRQLRHVRLAVMSSVTYHVLPLAIARFRSEFSEVTFHVTAGLETDMVRAVLMREADIGVGYQSAITDEADTLFRHETHLRALALKSHPLARATSVSAHDLMDVPLALPEPGSHTRRLIEAGAHRARVTLQASVETNSVEMRLKVAADGDTVAILLSGNVPRPAYPNLVPLRLAPEMFDPMAITAFKAPGVALSPAAAKFIVTLRSVMEAEEQSDRLRARERDRSGKPSLTPQADGGAEGAARQTARRSQRLPSTASRRPKKS